jgi:hypothetical protein
VRIDSLDESVTVTFIEWKKKLRGHTADTTARSAVDALADHLGLLDLRGGVAIRVAIQARISAKRAAPDLSETALHLRVILVGLTGFEPATT